MTNPPPLPDLDQLLQEAIARKQLRKEDQYVPLLIKALQPHPNGLSRRQAIEHVIGQRHRDGLPTPKKEDDTVQSAMNRYCIHSKVFQKRNTPPENGIFFWPQGSGKGIWAVNLEKAANWLRMQKNK